MKFLLLLRLKIKETQMIRGFKEFLLKNNVLALAVAVIVGGAVGKVVSSLAADIIMPLIGLVIPGGEMALRQTRAPVKSIGCRMARNHQCRQLRHIHRQPRGLPDHRLRGVHDHQGPDQRTATPAPPAPSKNCPRCKEAIALDATKCKFCTADI